MIVASLRLDQFSINCMLAQHPWRLAGFFDGHHTMQEGCQIRCVSWGCGDTHEGMKVNGVWDSHLWSNYINYLKRPVVFLALK